MADEKYFFLQFFSCSKVFFLVFVFGDMAGPPSLLERIAASYITSLATSPQQTKVLLQLEFLSPKKILILCPVQAISSCLLAFSGNLTGQLIRKQPISLRFNNLSLPSPKREIEITFSFLQSLGDNGWVGVSYRLCPSQGLFYSHPFLSFFLKPLFHQQKKK